ncbi:MAG: hypothetical protein A2747_02940 [Candidatus Yonathbacteria bacterium RIFCSPHIGHO2_01_FULL_44_41]|uniref:Uncharacterized protein n=1 Tax=Candidatus Yonathbacteria bacterium RIFCSPHIGHO2_02_FULL_44_14 TaxID=1802724 RepID=A0A1G2S654_9BACT|nr:MAG: hypothetical protein A2747_02940 [Candidatus Yonathbacteria bacterium RIFCSPHIGHO2_01_FULL_44_41]OHA80536.1 MAG: hypothetical protein A3D51_00450 [Candidatus Yonathbacteria bacterium RIFCSPHIGHO2_02_FULL_44_14]OHA82172.1 MAG: hypothetical protein A3B06_01545 [Candidatus Yonathbacteria bacterium RIFCSPLOWO2_01_FULL_43_20]
MTKPITSFVVLILSTGFIFFYVVPAYNINRERRDSVGSLTKTLSAFSEISMLVDKTKKNLSSIGPAEMSRLEVFLPEKIDEIRFANNIQSIGTKNRISLSNIKVEGPANGTQKTTTVSGTNAAQGLVGTLSISDKSTAAKINNTEFAVTKSSAGAAVLAKKYATTKAKFTFTATFETFQLFLNDLEKSLGLMDITSLSFVPLPEDKSVPRTGRTSADSKPKGPVSPIYQFTLEMETYLLK